MRKQVSDSGIVENLMYSFGFVKPSGKNIIYW